jgi:uncharacterized protein
MVHQYKLNGYNIVLDTASGSVHAVDEVAYDIIALYPDHGAEDIIQIITARYPDVTARDVEECLSDVKSLKDAGKLFSEDPYADLAFDFKKRPVVVKALMVCTVPSLMASLQGSSKRRCRVMATKVTAARQRRM